MDFRKENKSNKHNHDAALAEQVIKTMESVIDSKLEELESMDSAELERLREERIKNLKKAAARDNELISKGHGEYDDVEEKLFFKVSTNSEKVIAHFYAGNLPVCDLIHAYLKDLAKSHLESRFVRVNAEKSPFLVSRLNIKHFPTILIIIDGNTVDRIVGNSDLFKQLNKTALEWRLSQRGGINYDGDFDPSDLKTRRTNIRKIYKTIREVDESSSGDD